MQYSDMKKIITTFICSLFVIWGLLFGTGQIISADVTGDYIRGDLDLNNVINAKDALSVLKVSAGLEDAEINVADVNKDGNVSARDALMILKHVVKLFDYEELLETYGSGHQVAKIGNGSYDIAPVTYLRSKTEYEEYIDTIVEKYPDAFGGINDSQLLHAWYYDDRLDGFEDIVALYIENPTWENVEYTIEKVSTDGVAYNVDISSYIPEDTVEGNSAWCIFVEVSKDDNVDGVVTASVTEEVEIMADTVGERGTWHKSYMDVSDFEEGVQIISEYSRYKELLNDSFEEEDRLYMDIYPEEFFADNVLVAVKYEAPYISYYDIIPERITKINGKYRIYIECLQPEIGLPAVGNWISLIPSDIKEWDDCEFEFKKRSYTVSGMTEDLNEAEAVTFKLSDNLGKDYRAISTYKEFIEFMSEINPKVEREYIDDRIPMGYSEEYFIDNSVVFIQYTEYRSSMIDILYSDMETVGFGFGITLEAHFPNGPITEDSASWGILIPVEGKNWDYYGLGKITVIDIKAVN